MREKKYYPWLVVALLWGVALLNYMDRQMLSTMKEAMQVDIIELQSATNFGRLMAIFLWIYAFMSPVAGMVADRFNRKWLIVCSLFVWSGVTYLMGIVSDFNLLYLLRAVMGVSEALYIPAALALIADYHSDRTRSLAIGIHMTGLYTGQAIGGFGATVAEATSWQTTFHYFGLVGIAYAILLIFFLYEIKNRNVETTEVVKSAEFRFGNLLKPFANFSFFILLLYFAIPSLPGWATKNWLPTLYAENLNLPMAEAGPIATITIAVSSFVGVIIGGILSDWWIHRNIRGRIYVGVIGLGLLIPALILLGLGTNLVAIVGAGVLFGIGYGMFDANNMPIVVQIVSKKYRSTAYGILNLAGIIAGAMITQILGHWKENDSLGLGFAYLAVAVGVVLLIQLFFMKPKYRDMP
ncbi:MAG: MFS transporter [Candidatus Ornithobacterium hominis]|uniref:MFS transporter n=1 Tax=Candidatus Ornithobacterium hominis TaxID=2497989 RepID=UPI000E5B5D0D|nr:MFS transporter [Candidatus Ornithobacterium hominis]MCT7904997.1 MFS transporter [Candidatus Ornithobacterium hominis]